MGSSPRAINSEHNSLYNYPRGVYGISLATQKPMRNFDEVSIPFIFRGRDPSEMLFSFSTRFNTGWSDVFAIL